MIPKEDAERPIFFDWSWNTQEENFPSPTPGHLRTAPVLKTASSPPLCFSPQDPQQAWNRHLENKNFLKNNFNVNFQNGKFSWQILTARTPTSYSPKDVFLRFKTQLTRNIHTRRLKTPVFRVCVHICAGGGGGGMSGGKEEPQSCCSKHCFSPSWSRPSSYPHKEDS